jgi:VanZ family protein
MKLPSPLRHALLWLVCFCAWFGILWRLSSGPVEINPGWEIPHLDKACHFGYFFGGSGLLSAFLYRLSRRSVDWAKLLACVMFIMTLAGALDEWHQSWVPERSGNDALDLCADVLGSLAGFAVFRKMHRWIDDN